MDKKLQTKVFYMKATSVINTLATLGKLWRERPKACQERKPACQERTLGKLWRKKPKADWQLGRPEHYQPGMEEAGVGTDFVNSGDFFSYTAGFGHRSNL